MANKEHLEKLQQGVDVWNGWREENPDIKPDLGYADLRAANLSYANLDDADLRSAKLEAANLGFATLCNALLGRANLVAANLNAASLCWATLNDANLSQANLAHADFYAAKLINANLSESNPSQASFMMANLWAANLCEANLVRADFKRANLESAHLNGAILDDAVLEAANLSEARLRGAKLRAANLCAANLAGANLAHALLNKANLAEANFVAANLAKANLKEARLWHTAFADCRLSEAKGLEACRHTGPSSIDHRTIVKSGPLPVAFLKGCGWADWQIEAARLYDPRLSSTAIAAVTEHICEMRQRAQQSTDLFISCSHKDAPFTDALEKRLQADGIRYWRHVHDNGPGPWKTAANIAMSLTGAVLLVLSQHSVASDWVQWEFKRARRLEQEVKEHVLCPVALDKSWQGCGWPNRLMKQVNQYDILDFADWSENQEEFNRQYEKLLKGLRLFR